MIWDPAFRGVRSQLDIIFDEERNAHATCLHGDHTDIFKLPEETEYGQEIETGADEHRDNHGETSQTGDGHRINDHNCTDDDTDHNLPHTDNW